MKKYLAILILALFLLGCTGGGQPQQQPPAQPPSSNQIPSSPANKTSATGPYTTTFIAEGLPPNALWSVSYSNQTKSSNSTTISFTTQESGNYDFKVNFISAPNLTNLNVPINYPSNVAYDPENNEVYFVGFSYIGDEYLSQAMSGGKAIAESIYAVDASTNKVSQNISIDVSPNLVVFDPANSEIYVGSMYGGTLTAIDGSPSGNNNIIKQLQISKHFGDFSNLLYDQKSGNIYAYLSDNDTYTIISSKDNTVIDNVNSSAIPQGLVPTSPSAYDSKNGYNYTVGGPIIQYLSGAALFAGNVTVKPQSGTAQTGSTVTVNFTVT